MEIRLLHVQPYFSNACVGCLNNIMTANALVPLYAPADLEGLQAVRAWPFQC